jgi:RNA polymerase sigma-54 factor
VKEAMRLARQRLEQVPHQVQNLTLTADVLLSLKVLELSATELTAYLHKVVEGNPVVELVEPERGSAPMRIPWRSDEDVDAVLEVPDDRSDEIYDDLKQQVAWLLPAGPERDRACFLIDNLDPDGYLRIPLSDLQKKGGCTVSDLQQALEIVWQCEPAGVGARDLTECLQLQAARRWGENHPVTRLLREQTDVLTHLTVPRIARALHISINEARDVLAQLKLLRPRPYVERGGRGVYMTPDIIATRGSDGEIMVEVLRDQYPGLRYVPEYLNLRKTTRDRRVYQFLTEALRQAQVVEQALARRTVTLGVVSRCLVQAQAGYCFDGRPLNPVMVKDVAQATGFHESTIRRTVAGKVLSCPRGLLPLAHLFCEPVNQMTVSTDAVKTAIRHLVQAESPDAPLSDMEISQRLQAMGMAVSRRTVAKYRLELGIPTSLQRRR